MRTSENPSNRGIKNPPKSKESILLMNLKIHLARKQTMKVPNRKVPYRTIPATLTNHPPLMEMTPENEPAARTKSPPTVTHPMSKWANIRARNCSRWIHQPSILAIRILIELIQWFISSLASFHDIFA